MDTDYLRVLEGTEPETEIVDCRKDPWLGAQMGGELIAMGELVAFPTETVYGLGANGLDAEAVRRIFKAKGRPGDNPLIMHIENQKQIERLWTEVPHKAQVLMHTFWPGPLTLIYHRAGIVPDEVTAGLSTVAVRMPDNEVALALIKEAGVPIAAPSANLSGKPSPTTAEHVLADMKGKIPLILDGGPCRFGVESTVLSLIGTPTILRPGAVTREMLEAVIGHVELASCLLKPMEEGEKVLSPGMKYKHYAPKAQVHVVTGTPEKAALRIVERYAEFTQAGKKVSVAGTRQTMGYYKARKMPAVLMGDRDNPVTLCANLFTLLRTLDEEGAEIILCEGISPEGTGLAYMNRLLRAAGFEVEEV